MTESNEPLFLFFTEAFYLTCVLFSNSLICTALELVSECTTECHSCLAVDLG